MTAPRLRLGARTSPLSSAQVAWVTARFAERGVECEFVGITTTGDTVRRLARLHSAPFTDRLVAKFDLPTGGWRGAAERRSAGWDAGGFVDGDVNGRGDPGGPANPRGAADA